VQRFETNGQLSLERGADPSKDQSYFLFATTPEQLAYLRFPLGGMSKQETRNLARQFGLAVSGKPDSQDICFVPNGRYGDVVRRLRPGAVDAGDIRHLDGTVLGRHNGVIDYTIGQRRGLGIGGRAGVDESEGPLYVVGIDADTNTVLVGPQAALACNEVHLHDANWITGQPENGARVMARLRNTAPAVNARIFSDQQDVATAVIILDAPQYGIAGGQAAVLYQGDDANILLGGGWISKALLTTDMTHE
jgi:tRNA-specific 2-thiouridylase